MGRLFAAPLHQSVAITMMPIVALHVVVMATASGAFADTKTIPAGDNHVERTLILLKPDCVQRRLMGEVLARFEQKGLNVIAMKMMRVTPDLAKQHYAEHVAKPFYPGLESFITGGPIVAIILEGLEVIQVVRGMLGATNGIKAAAGTIRGDFSNSRQMNLVHASDSSDSAKREMELYFGADEICEYEPTLTPWMRADDE